MGLRWMSGLRAEQGIFTSPSHPGVDRPSSATESWLAAGEPVGVIRDLALDPFEEEWPFDERPRQMRASSDRARERHRRVIAKAELQPISPHAIRTAVGEGFGDVPYWWPTR